MNTLSELLGIAPKDVSKGVPHPTSGTLRARLETEILPVWLPGRRWFRSKTKSLAATVFEALFALPSDDGDATVLGIVRAEFADAEPERYLLPLALASPKTATALPEAARIGLIETTEGERQLVDACWDPGFRGELFRILFKQDTVTRETKYPIGGLRGLQTATADLHGVSGTVPRTASRVLSAEQSNTSLVYGSGSEAVFVKLYRKIDAGIHPEPEMLRFLREHTSYRHVPEFYSALEWVPHEGKTEHPATLALAQAFLPGGVNAWEHVLERLREPDESAFGTLLVLAAKMGLRVGELHAALGSRPDLSVFAPEPLTETDLADTRRKTRTLLASTLESLSRGNSGLAPGDATLARTVTEHPDRLYALVQSFGAAGENPGKKIRTHGDLHLGQMMVEDHDIRILDFEGEPGRTLAEARVKSSPLRDVAGMLRSFHYAVFVAEREAGASPIDEARVATRVDRLQRSFLSGYHPAVAGSGLLPEREADRRTLLDLFVLEKALYELQYEWNNRPDWAGIPLHGLSSLL